MRSYIETLVEQTPLADTHEHLFEERSRLEGHDGWGLKDFGVLFSNYMDAELMCAGMPEPLLREMLFLATPVERKWQILKPYWQQTKTTGYGLAVREALEGMFGETDVTDDNYRHISERIAEQIKPGFYKHLLRDVANIEHCQVNSLQFTPFCETDQPELYLKDLSTVALSTGLSIGHMTEHTGLPAETLDDWYKIIDWCFEKYGPRAVAVKNQSAYQRKLDYDDVPKSVAEPVFNKFLKDWETMTEADTKPLKDHLFNYTVRKAVEYNLPYKLHTGYYAGVDHMPLHRLRHNGGDMADLCMRHRDAKFIFMHITYPYQDEAIAVAKHHTNAYIDMCWAWIINPVASVRFLKEFLLAVPSNKLLSFGGDYLAVESVVGHARIARKGIIQALVELAEERWLREDDVAPLVERIMRGNANELFDLDRCRAVAPPAAAVA